MDFALTSSRGLMRVSLLLVLLWATPLAAQMLSPLQGQGFPEPETTQVFVSVYLDRLLKVNDQDYQHQSNMYFYITWRDSTAYAKMYNATEKLIKNGTACAKPCNNYATNTQCCDGIYLPSFYFRNAAGFPEDRAQGYNIYVTKDGWVSWTAFVHGVYYQPMDFRDFPFDSMDLMVELSFFSTHDLNIFSNTTHPGVEVVFSSGAPRLFSIGMGDESPQWAITEISFDSRGVDFGEWFLNSSTLYSNENDPAPLNPAPGTASWDSCKLEQPDPESEDNSICNVYSGKTEHLFAVFITVQRFWRYQLLNSVLPVVLCALLGSIVFMLDTTELSMRLEMTVTLFLSLTAVQFVLGEKQPQSSYVLPTQQLVITTYVYLAIAALESLAVHHIATWPQHKQAAKKRKAGWRRYRAALTAQALAKEGGKEGLPLDGDATDECNGSSTIEDGGGAATHAPNQGRWSPPRNALLFCFGGRKLKPPASAPTRVSTLTQLELDEAYASYVAHTIDIAVGSFCMLAYALAAILIFVLQNGYVYVFGE